MLEKFFQLKANNTNFQTELLAGITTFIALIGLVNSGFIVAKAPLTGVGEINAMTATFLLGLLVSIVLLVKKSKGAFIIGIIVTTSTRPCL